MGLTFTLLQRTRMDPALLNIERYECLDGMWTPMLAAGEDHFIGTVRHTVYSPGPYGYTTQILKTIHLVMPRPPYIATAGPTEIVDISSDSSSDDDDPDDEDYAPSEISVSSMSLDESEDSGYTDSSDRSPSPEYHPGEESAGESAPGPEIEVPVAAAPAEEEGVIIIDSSSEEESDPDDSVMIISDPDSDDLF